MPDEPLTPPIDLLIGARTSLHGGLGAVQRAAMAATGGDDALSGVDGALDYIRTVFLAQSRAEEFTLFTSIDGILGRRGATTAMVAQHRSIAAMAEDLEKVVARMREGHDIDRLRPAVIALLHGLYAAIRVHIESEDDAFLPLIESHLSESQIETLVTNLRRISDSIAAGGAPIGPHG